MTDTDMFLTFLAQFGATFKITAKREACKFHPTLKLTEQVLKPAKIPTLELSSETAAMYGMSFVPRQTS